jgi:hypothetical protein
VRDGGISVNSYNAGESERRMGAALRDGYREIAFLMTKFDGRTKAFANSLAKSYNLTSGSVDSRPTISISFSFARTFAWKIRTTSSLKTAR